MYYVTASDGTKIAVEDCGRTSKKTIVMVHGWPISKEMYEYQKDVLVDRGYRIVSFDIRGFGDSETSAGGYQYNQLATDLKNVIDSLDTQVFLVGFSMGGAICVHYMAMFDNHKVSKLILLGAAAPSFTKTRNNPYGTSRESVDALIMEGYHNRPQLVEDFGGKVFALHHGEPFQKWFRNLCFKASGIGTIKTAVSLRDEDVYSDLSKIKVPTLIMHGKLDQICPYGFATIMEKEIPGAKLDPFEYSGHGLFFDELGKCNHDMIVFLEDMQR